jgi:hypothetical protein
MALDFDEVYVHSVGRNLGAHGERVLPKLRWPER